VHIADGIFIGSVGAAMNKEYLSSQGISHIVTIAENISPLFPDEFTYHIVRISDSTDADLLT
jgi:hypothetical protein